MSFLKEKSEKSSTRLVFVVGSFWAMAITTYLAFESISPAVLLAFYSGIQGTLIGLKLGQKQQEKEKK